MEQYKLTENDYNTFLRYERSFKNTTKNIPETELDIIFTTSLVYTIQNYDRSRSKFSTFLYYIILNNIKLYYYKNNKVYKRPINEHELVYTEDDKDIVNAAWKVVDALTPFELTIFNLWLYGETINKVAQIVGLSRYRTNNIINSIIVKLRKEVWGIK
jgi:DNA-directed RNA polymerase specialized sigma subunit